MAAERPGTERPVTKGVKWVLNTLALELRFQTATRKVLQFPQLFHNQVRDGLVWVQLSKEHQGLTPHFTRACEGRVKCGVKNYKGQNQTAFSISRLKPLLTVHLIPI
jgi:hypothetical protein